MLTSTNCKWSIPINVNTNIIKFFKTILHFDYNISVITNIKTMV